MRLTDYLRIATKNLSRQKTRTFLTIVAITVGSLSLILMASLVLGVRQSLLDQFKQFGAFNLVTVVRDPNSVDNQSLTGTNGGPQDGKKITDQTVSDMRKLNHVVGATPLLTTGGGTMRLEDSQKKAWNNVIGFDPDSHVFDMPIIAGRTLQTDDMDKMVVGSRFVQDNKFSGHEQELIGKKVVMSMNGFGPGASVDWGPAPEKPTMSGNQDQQNPPQGNNELEITAEIVGVANNDTLGDGASYITLAWAQRLNTRVSWQVDQAAMSKARDAQQRLQEQQQRQSQNGRQGGQPFQQPTQLDPSQFLVLHKDSSLQDQGYSSLMLKVDDTANLSSVVDQVSKLGYGAVTAQTMLNQINQIMLIVSLVLGAVAGISLFVAAIGIINTMIMATYERTREIGVMRACGATRATVRRLFTLEAAALGFWGGLFGLAISVALGQLARLLVTRFGASLGSLPVNNIGKFPLWLIAAVIVFTTLVGTLSGLYPAFRAARLKLVDALRYE